MQQEDELLDAKEVADLLHINPRTVLRMAERGELKAIKVARRLRFRRSDLSAYLQGNYSLSSSEASDEDSLRPDISRIGASEPVSELDLEERRLGLERQRLKIAKERAEMIENANKLAHQISPDDAQKRAELLQTFLSHIFESKSVRV